MVSRSKERDSGGGRVLEEINLRHRAFVCVV